MTRKTFFIDIDGTILNHVDKDLYKVTANSQFLCPNVINKLNEIESQGHCIVLTTARKESMRRLTEEQLAFHGIFYDHLLMGIGQGERVIVNDKRSNGENRARAVNIVRNEGLGEMEV